MKTLLPRLLVVLFLAATALHAQVPQLINYQGRVAVDGLNFDGTGQFKFAFVSAAGTTTYWSNDGTSTAGAEPTASVALTVTQGLYSVLLGDATLPGMTIVPATVFTHGDVHLRVWFNDGPHGFQLLTPDKRIAAVGYAMIADSVVDGAITSAKLADGAVTATKLSPGAALANLDAAGQSGVPSGGLVLSATESLVFLNAGYIKLGTTSTSDTWQQRTNGTPPAVRGNHSVVWTGSEMIVWGGANYDGSSHYLNDGGRYNPTSNNWAAVSTVGAPSMRSNHTSVWTGSEMLVWGGLADSGQFSTGGRYNPTADSWAVITTTSAPSARNGQTAVWTGSEMIVWGGYSGSSYVNDGGRYNPTTNSWNALPASGLSGRSGHRAVWTGSEMIVWGGYNSSSHVNDGARYNPTSNIWSPMTSVAAPSGRSNSTAVWTGSEMIVWGGNDQNMNFNSGGRYDPISNSWTTLSISGAPTARILQTAIWTGSEMIIWGGDDGGSSNTGGRYNLVANSWQPVSTSGAPASRRSHTAVWTGSEMIVWGGWAGGSNYLNDTWSYTPGRLLYLYQRP